MPTSIENNNPRRYFDALREVRQACATLPAERQVTVVEIKKLITNGEVGAAFILLEVLQSTIEELCRSTARFAAGNCELKLERAISNRGAAESALKTALQDGDREGTMRAETCIQVNNEWMALSIEYLEQA